MSLDPSKLEKNKQRGTGAVARCPVCASIGADKHGVHLKCWDANWEGAYSCINKCDTKMIFDLVGMKAPGSCHRSYDGLPTPKLRPEVKRPILPADMRPLTRPERNLICKRRGFLCDTGLQHLTRRRQLWFGSVWDDGRYHPAWFITDGSRRHAQARRLDGKKWTGVKAKAKTIPGSTGSWPIGAADMDGKPLVILCEGGPDFLAAPYVLGWEGHDKELDDVAVVCMAGAGLSIHDDALPLFAGKRVCICVHHDPTTNAGALAFERWSAQLVSVGAKVDGFTAAGLTRADGETPCKDLADFASLFDSGEAPSRVMTSWLFALRTGEPPAE